MNKGIKDYFKMISNSISNDTTTLVNINSKYANFHIIINLYKSDEVRSIPLSLVYTLTENVTNTGFGNGFKLNFYNKNSSPWLPATFFKYSFGSPFRIKSA